MSTITLSKDDQHTLQTAAYGVVALLTAGDTGIAMSARIGSAAGNVVRTATGLVGHVLNDKRPKPYLKGRTIADIADVVLPAVTDSLRILEANAPAEVDNFRRTIATAVEAAEYCLGGQPNPAAAEIMRKIAGALEG
ncbi:hypothetical protein [Nocardia crassostreae]|uniref:hypothetical protein n=1 Tax=Nocardia crassostreae TaxID=53428 RepID=UPI000831FA5B|nr:hypothetical protein [Nocardia crassostreae]